MAGPGEKSGKTERIGVNSRDPGAPDPAQESHVTTAALNDVSTPACTTYTTQFDADANRSVGAFVFLNIHATRPMLTVLRLAPQYPSAKHEEEKNGP